MRRHPLRLTLPLTALLLAAGCDTSDAVGGCGEAGSLVAIATGRYCAYIVIRGGFECPETMPFRVEVGDAVVCSEHADDPRSLPEAVCVRLEGRCDAAREDGPEDAGSSDATDAAVAPDAAAPADGPPADAAPPECSLPTESFVDAFDKRCDVESDCAVVSHQIDCCGSHLAFAVRSSEATRAEAAEATCAYPLCLCVALWYVEGVEEPVFDLVGPGEDAFDAHCVDHRCTAAVRTLER